MPQTAPSSTVQDVPSQNAHTQKGPAPAIPEDAPRMSLPKIFAATCPLNTSHKNTSVYSTAGRTRYCKCNDCGETWKQVGEFSNPLKEFCQNLAASLEKAPRVDAGEDNGRIVILPDRLAVELAEQLRELISS